MTVNTRRTWPFEGGGVAVSRGRRSAMSSHWSGVLIESRGRRSVRLVIGFLHELTQASSPSTEVDMDRRHADVERFGDFFRRAVRVVVHHHRDPLIDGKP